jgi:hypothetical protein
MSKVYVVLMRDSYDDFLEILGVFDDENAAELAADANPRAEVVEADMNPVLSYPANERWYVVLASATEAGGLKVLCYQDRPDGGSLTPIIQEGVCGWQHRVKLWAKNEQEAEEKAVKLLEVRGSTDNLSAGVQDKPY